MLQFINVENLESLSIRLVKPSAEFKDSFIKGVEEFQAEGLGRFQNVDIEELRTNFEGYIHKLQSREKGEGLPEGRVPQSEFWLVDSGEFVGVVKIRHRLNEALLKMGGNIGYFIIPSKRRMGYGTKALELALPLAKKLGIEKVLITCDDSNEGSYRIIEKNRGVLENKIEHEGVLKRRYWIENK